MQTMMWMLFITVICAGGVGAMAAGRGEAIGTRMTAVTIAGEQFFINGRPTYEGRQWNGHRIEGLLLNVRFVQATFDDMNSATVHRWAYADTGQWDPQRNTREFIEMIPQWRKDGLLAFTVNLQGGAPGGGQQENPEYDNSAFEPDGSLRPAFMARMERVIDRADALGMVVILGCFYFLQDERLADEQAVIDGVDNVREWVLERGYTNVLIEIANECNMRNGYQHEILQPSRVHELIQRVRRPSADGRRLLASVSYTGGRLPGPRVLETADFVLLHGNGIDDPARIAQMVRDTRAKREYRPMPILFNEDDHYDSANPTNNFIAAIAEHASWGYFDWEGYQHVPADWRTNTPRKRAFFRLLREITGCDVTR